MCRTHRNITVVGDDAQSIYSFRGASFRNILDFPKQFPGATVVTLEQNYRSTQPILDVDQHAHLARAGAVHEEALDRAHRGREARGSSRRRTSTQQTRFVVDRILELHEEGTPLREIAVLFRAGYMSADLEIELTNRKIPFEKWGGIKFLEAAHVKDVLAFLRVLENPRDEVSWYRILMLLPGIGDVTARHAIDRDARALLGRRRLRGVHRRRPAPGRARGAGRDAARAARLALGGRARRRPGRARRGRRRPRHRPRSASSTTTSSASVTTAPSRASPTSTSSRRSPPASPAAAPSSRRSPSSRRRARRIWPAAATARTTRSSSAPRTARRGRNGTPSSSSGRSTAGSPRPAR